MPWNADADTDRSVKGCDVLGYTEYLRSLLRPLGIYDLDGGEIIGAELAAEGAALDSAAARVANAEREGILTTAEGEGLSLREALYARRPVNESPVLRRQAIAALAMIGNDSFTLEAINKTIDGCGISALAEETDEYGLIRVIFPETAGVPAEFERISEIILDIIPCHLETYFYFRYLTFDECEAFGWTWDMVEAAKHTWESFELAV